jgi:hypothetical protein
MIPAEKIWWIKVAASIAVAWISLMIQGYLGGITTFLMGVIVYIFLSNVVANVMGVDTYRGLKIGVGAYFFTWLTIWILLNTYLTTYA